MSLKEVIAAAFNKDAMSFESALNDVMQEKMANAVQSYFSSDISEETDLEEVEQIDETSKSIVGKNILVLKGINTGSYGTVAAHKDDKVFVDYKLEKPNGVNQNNGHWIHHSDVKVVGESVEQIDEISKKTLGSYIKKAAPEIVGRTVASMYNTPESKKYASKLGNRVKGTNVAASKLAKEETEQIDEISKDLKKRYGDAAAKEYGSSALHAAATVNGNDDARRKLYNRLTGLSIARGHKLNGEKPSFLRKEETEE